MEQVVKVVTPLLVHFQLERLWRLKGRPAQIEQVAQFKATWTVDIVLE